MFHRSVCVAGLACLGLALSVCSADAVTWDNTSGDMLWSTGTNWNPDLGGLPGSGDTVLFDKTTAAGSAGVLTNTLDGSPTVAGLSYELDSAASAITHHTTIINSGQTLTVNGPFFAGFESGTNQGTVASVTIKGSSPATGAVVVNAGSTDIVFGSTHGFDYPTYGRTFTADLGELGTFNAATTGIFYLGWGWLDPVTLTLADSNSITAGRIALGGWNATCQINLGTSNTINTDSITLCQGIYGNYTNSGAAVIQFDSGLTNPAVAIRDAAGSGRADVLIAYGANSSGVNYGTVDFWTGTSGTGYVDALFGSVVVGRGYPSSGGGADGNGTLTFGAGTIDATSITLGYTSAGTRAANDGIGTLNMHGPGTLIVGTLTLGDKQGDGGATGTVNLNAGTLRAATIQKGAGSGTFNWSAGTVGNKSGGDLTINANLPLTLLTTADHIFDVESGQTLDANSVISESGAVAPVVKTGAGTLALGATNTYTGGTTVEEGKLVIGATNAINAGNSLSFGGASGATADTALDVNFDQTLGSFSCLTSSASTASYQHDMTIAAGRTLTVNGPFAMGVAGLGPNGATATGTFNVTGDGSLVVNAGTNNVVMGPTDGTYNNGVRNTTIDMSGLASFSATTSGYFYLGTGHRDPVTLYLADSNTITASKLSIGGWNATNTMYLGQSNVLNVDMISLCTDVPGAWANNACISSMRFRSGLTNPTLVVRDSSGSGPADLRIGYGASHGGNNQGRVDFSAGSVDALLGAVIIGQGHPSMGSGDDGIGTLTFGAGTVDADSISVGHTATGTRSTNEGFGTLNIQGPGTLTVGTLTLGDKQGDGGASGTVNLDGGTLAAATIQKGAGSGTFAWSAGTIANKSGGDLSIAAGLPITLDTTAVHTFDAETGRTITVDAVISGAAGTGGISKIGDGTLVLAGDNTYSGSTLVTAGTLLVNNVSGSGTGSGTVTVQNGAALGGLGFLDGLATIQSGGHLAPGTSPGTLTFNGGLTLEDGSILDFELGSPADLIDINGGTFTGAGSGGVTLNIADGGGAGFGAFVLIDWADAAGASGVDLADFTLGPTSLLGELVLTSTTLEFSYVPEPSTAVLALLGLLALSFRPQRAGRRYTPV